MFYMEIYILHYDKKKGLKPSQQNSRNLVTKWISSYVKADPDPISAILVCGGKRMDRPCEVE